MKSRTLAEELADLAVPSTTEVDPDADALGAGPALLESDGEAADGAQQAPRSGRQAPERALRMRHGIDLDSAEYAGRKSSRQAVFGSDALPDEQNGRDSEPESGSQPLDDADSGSGDASDMSGPSEDAVEDEDALEGTSDGEEAEDDGEDVAEASEEEADLSAAAALTGTVDEEMRALEAEYDAAAAADAQAAAGLAQRAAKERLKGAAVARQREVWERALELRILLQRCLAASHQLPHPETHAAVQSASVELGQAFLAVAQEAAAVVDDLSDLQEALMEQSPAIREASSAAARQPDAQKGGKRRREQASVGSSGADDLNTAKWRRLEDLHGDFVPFRDASIDRWHRKTLLSGGNAAMRANLRSLDQSVSHQVAAAMANPGKLLTRTQLIRATAPRILCQPSAQPSTAATEAAKDLPDAATEPQGPVERDPETYDDAELYQQLLKEFLESSAGAGTRTHFLVGGPKKRKAMDRRASKGRKLRYHVHEKLVNFMTPTEEVGSAPGLASQLFGSLFGRAMGQD